MSDTDTKQTTTAKRHPVRVRRLPDGDIGITIGSTEFGMPSEEAAQLAAKIIQVWCCNEQS